MTCFQNKKISILFVFLMIFLLNSSRLAAVILHSEKIRNYEVTVQINKNGTLTVNEVIDYQLNLSTEFIEIFLCVQKGLDLMFISLLSK